MPRRLALAALLAAAPLAAAQTPEGDGEANAPPFPEYPDFRPGAVAAADQKLYSLALLDLFEVAPAGEGVPARVEGFYRIGTDYNKVYLKAEGEGLVAEGEGGVEAQVLYSRLVTEYFEAQVGLRLDTEFGDGDVRARPQLAVGLEGLAPYFFEVEPALFVSAKGDVSARLEGSYDLLVTQRLVLQPEAEVNLAIQRVEDWGVGTGLNDIEVGLRLRYEIQREVAPYVGVSWLNRFGEAHDIARAEGEPTSEAFVVFGLRLWR
ncbi:copper resistance protein B [Rubrivirga sp. S365]|uniref:copper resistance protein B n=1 Tax=Rubrivirga sp. S365 TaxID=3076080 RepID=UPI0028CAA213|nr:copper resistance protein B [Rubrivirga sp. S365]MDT7856429.1 copper resistance protein B [Rubrivirga sp. S365]